MAGKTGTAQVRKISGSQRGQVGAWKYRDHGLFVFFTPADAPRYAGAVVIEHGLGGARAAAPVAKDVMTYLYDPAQAMASLTALEEGWGGDPGERFAKKSAAYRLANDPAAAAAAAQGSVDDDEVDESAKKDKAEAEKVKDKPVPAEAPVEREAEDSDEPVAAAAPSVAPPPAAPQP